MLASSYLASLRYFIKEGFKLQIDNKIYYSKQSDVEDISLKLSYPQPFTLSYHLISALAQVKPDPNAARQTKSPSLIFPASQASHKAIGTDAAVVFPYF